MPRVKQYSKPDYLMELIQGRRAGMNMTIKQLSAKTGKTEAQLKYLFKHKTDEWNLGDIKCVCKALEVPIDTLREKIRL